MAELQYEPSVAAQPVRVEDHGEIKRVVVRMAGMYVPMPAWVADLDVLALIVIPVWWVTVAIVRTCLRLPKPPRAVFEVGPQVVNVTMIDPGGGTVRYSWNRAAICAMRANRYEKGFWIDVTGSVKETVLKDVSRKTIEQLEAAMKSVMGGNEGENRT